MARTHNLTRWNQTQQGENRCNKQANTPINTNDSKSFLGAIQYFAKFIRNLSAETADNMRRLFKKRTKWDWTEDLKTDFNKIKQGLTSLPYLAHYNGSKENIVTSDACETVLEVAL